MIQFFQRLKNKKGFTLIELIVVIAIIAILILIAVPAYQAYVRSSSENALDASAATIAKAATIHAASDNSLDLSDAEDAWWSDIEDLVDADTTGWVVTIDYNAGSETIEVTIVDGDYTGYFPKDNRP